MCFDLIVRVMPDNLEYWNADFRKELILALFQKVLMGSFLIVVMGYAPDYLASAICMIKQCVIE